MDTGAIVLGVAVGALALAAWALWEFVGDKRARRLPPDRQDAPAKPAEDPTERRRIAAAIARVATVRARRWDLYEAAVQIATEEDAIQATREALLAGSTQLPSSTFDVLQDAWKAYVACPHGADAGEGSEHIIIEVLDPYEPCSEDVLNAVRSRGRLRLDGGAFYTTIDFAEVFGKRWENVFQEEAQPKEASEWPLN